MHMLLGISCRRLRWLYRLSNMSVSMSSNKSNYISHNAQYFAISETRRNHSSLKLSWLLIKNTCLQSRAILYNQTRVHGSFAKPLSSSMAVAILWLTKCINFPYIALFITFCLSSDLFTWLSFHILPCLLDLSVIIFVLIILIIIILCYESNFYHYRHFMSWSLFLCHRHFYSH